MIVNFEFYHVFYMVAKYKNITRAADELCISQSSVSRNIQNLESYLKCKLFVRIHNGVLITPEGESLFQQIEPACKAIFEAENIMAQVNALAVGIIRISTNDIGAKFLSPYIEEVYRKYPNVIFQISCSAPTEIYAALNSGNIDLALDFDLNLDESIKNMPLDPIKESLPVNKSHEISRRVIGTFSDVAIVGEKFSHLCNKQISVEDLVKYPMILPIMDKVSKEFYKNLFLQFGRKSTAELEISGVTMRTQFTMQNFGISFVPVECIKDEIEEKKLFALNVEEKLLQRQMVMMTSKKRQLSVAARRFVDLLENRHS